MAEHDGRAGDGSPDDRGAADETRATAGPDRDPAALAAWRRVAEQRDRRRAGGAAGGTDPAPSAAPAGAGPAPGPYGAPPEQGGEAAAGRLHDVLLALAGRLDDDALSSVRELVAVEDDAGAAELLGGCLLAEGVGVSPGERAVLTPWFAATRVDPDLLDAVPTSAPSGPAPDHRFVADAAPGAPGADAAALALARAAVRLPGVSAVRQCWRVTPAGRAAGPVPHRIVLVETDATADSEHVAHHVAHAARDLGAVSVEVLASGVAPTAYHRAALAVAVLLDPHDAAGEPAPGDRAVPPARPSADAAEPAAGDGGRDVDTADAPDDRRPPVVADTADPAPEPDPARALPEPDPARPVPEPDRAPEPGLVSTADLMLAELPTTQRPAGPSDQELPVSPDEPMDPDEAGRRIAALWSSPAADDVPTADGAPATDDVPATGGATFGHDARVGDDARATDEVAVADDAPGTTDHRPTDHRPTDRHHAAGAGPAPEPGAVPGGAPSGADASIRPTLPVQQERSDEERGQVPRVRRPRDPEQPATPLRGDEDAPTSGVDARSLVRAAGGSPPPTDPYPEAETPERPATTGEHRGHRSAADPEPAVEAPPDPAPSDTGPPRVNGHRHGSTNGTTLHVGDADARTAPLVLGPEGTPPEGTGPVGTGLQGTGPVGTGSQGTGPVGTGPVETGPVDPGPADARLGPGAVDPEADTSDSIAALSDRERALLARLHAELEARERAGGVDPFAPPRPPGPEGRPPTNGHGLPRRPSDDET